MNAPFTTFIKSETILIILQQQAQKGEKDKVDGFANAMKYEHKSKILTTCWNDSLKLKKNKY